MFKKRNLSVIFTLVPALSFPLIFLLLNMQQNDLFLGLSAEFWIGVVGSACLAVSIVELAKRHRKNR